jgi:hypothetical protein
LRFALFFAHSWRSVAPPHEDNDCEDASFLEVISAIYALEIIKIQKGEFLVPLDTLRRTPVTKEEYFPQLIVFTANNIKEALGKFN